MRSFTYRITLALAAGALAACSNSINVIDHDGGDVAVGDTAADHTSDVPTDIAPDRGSDAPVDVAHDAPSEAATDAPADVTSDRGTDAPLDVTSDVSSDVPVDAPLDVPGEGGVACSSNAGCASSEYCAGAACTGPGTCQTRPSICSGLFAPVCGCNGTTYSNMCLAAAAGVRVSTSGACPTTDGGVGDAGGSCTGGTPCPSGLTCCASTGTCYDPRCLACCR